MIRKNTGILVTVGLLFIAMATGCSDSDDAIVEPSDRDAVTTRLAYKPGSVLVHFDQNASLFDIDVAVRSFGLNYNYLYRGEVWAHTHVVAGDPLNIQERVSESPLVARAKLFDPRYGETLSRLKIEFVAGVDPDDALMFVTSYPELAVTSTHRLLIVVEFEVPVGDEDEWVNRLLEEDLVIDAHKNWYAHIS